MVEPRMDTNRNIVEFKVMVIQMIFGDGDRDDPDAKVKTRTYRDVVANVTLQQYIEGFYAHRESFRWGKLVQLKGKDRKVLRTFGKYPNGETVTN